MSVDPVADAGIRAQGAQPSASTSGTMDKDLFLKLFITQVQYQDPLNPVTDAEFTSQLAQFTMLEELVAANDNLAGLQLTQNMSTNAQLTNFIGKEVKALGNTIVLKGDETPTPVGEGESILGDKTTVARLHFELAEPADNVVVTIRDMTGTPVRAIDLGSLGEGEHEVGWNGLGNDGEEIPGGDYSFSVAAKTEGKDEAEVQAIELIMGQVTGVTFENGETLLVVDDDFFVSLSEILSLNKPGDDTK